MTPDELLASDPGLRRCWEEVVTGERPLSLDGVLSCFGDADEEAAAGCDVPFPPESSSADVAVQLGLPFRLSDGRVVLPRELVESIRRSYAGVSKHGFLTERDLEEKLYEWLSEG